MPPTDGRRPGRTARIGGVAVPVALTGIAALHAAWALGWRWPGGSDRAFADRVVGEGAALPPEAATWAVTGLLLGAAGVVGATGRCAGSMPVRAAALGVAGVMLGRGAVGLALDVAGGFGTTYQRLDATIYSPLCVALGAGTLAVLTPRRARSTQLRLNASPGSGNQRARSKSGVRGGSGAWRSAGLVPASRRISRASARWRSSSGRSGWVVRAKAVSRASGAAMSPRSISGRAGAERWRQMPSAGSKR